MNNPDYLIVGAGISGLTSALTILNSSPKAKLLIVDSSDDVGGLLRSETFNGSYFDLGTHIPEITSNVELNELLFPSEECRNWNKISSLKVGNFFGRHLNERTQFLDITVYPHLAEKVRSELLAISELTPSDDNFYSYSTQAYGPSLTEEVFSPLLFKLTGFPLNSLSVNSSKYYGLKRIICADREQSIALKKNTKLDNLLAYADDLENPRQSYWFYPESGGVGSWVQLLKNKIANYDVTFKFKTLIKHVLPKDNNIQVLLSDGGSIQVQNVIWTIPIYLGLNSVAQEKPLSRAISILHYTSNKKYLTECHYIYCHDSSLKSYRITLYDNLQKSKINSVYRCSVEVIHDVGSEPCYQEILNELKLMHIFSQDSDISFIGCNNLPSGFPIPLAGSENKKQNEFLNVCINNPKVTFVGRSKPHFFFMSDVLNDSYNQTKELLAGKGG